MGRQILVFLLVFVGIMLATRSCFDRPAPAHGLAVERAAPPVEAPIVLRHPGTGAVARLTPDGAVESIEAGEAPVVRPTSASRRPFHLLLGQTAGRRDALPAAEWKREELPDGQRFVFARESLRVERTVRFTEDGKGLAVALRAEGVPRDAVGLVMTGASGVPLPTSDSDAASFAFWQVDGAATRALSQQSLVQAREEEAGRGRPYAVADRLGADAKVRRFGIVGEGYYLSLEDLPPVSELFVDIYRAAREGAETEEVETWLDLVARDGAYEGTFTLRWLPRAEVPDDLRRNGELRPARALVLEDGTFRVELTDRGAAIRAAYLKPYSSVAGERPSPGNWVPILHPGVREGERALTLHADLYGGDPAHDTWDAEASSDGRSVRFVLRTPLGWRFTKTVTLPETGRFDLGIGIEVEAPTGASETEAVFRLVGPAGSYIVDSYRGIIGADPPAAYILERGGGSDESQAIDALVKGDLVDRAYAQERRGLFKAVGLRGAYFVCSLVSEDPRNAVTSAVAKAIRLSQPIARADGTSSADSMVGRVGLALPLEAGKGAAAFRLYAGPNETAALRPLDIGESVNFGFFGAIGRALMWLMKSLHGLVGSYGVAIILMTFIVRALLLPISYRTQLSMQRYSKRIQKIKPLLDEIQKRHAKDPQRMNQERMKVMREHGVGLPVGCLTIFLQIPIWFALFQALRVEFALRHQPFLWAADLSMPDRLFHLPLWPHWFNLLPIVMLVLWVVQQRVAPTPGSDDPQVKMQMKMMKFMPYVFFLMLYNYAAGLALYMCVSSLWSIAEGRLVRRAIARLG